MVNDGDGVLSMRLELHAHQELDPEHADRLVRRLRVELDELDVERATLAIDGPPRPAGAKGADPVTVGAVIVALSASGGVLTTVIGTLSDWLTRQSRRHRISVTIDGDTIELDRATAEQQRALLDAYIRRHTDG
ncbi:hypothetical protein GCM10009850_075480 [Nonomuraea monospora]|uniref:Uncharacterized protein n=1 Tax=Nonomuraea monospora TaxID=568818 RepID=A0ABN3CRK2_9ACTN